MTTAADRREPIRQLFTALLLLPTGGRSLLLLLDVSQVYSFIFAISVHLDLFGNQRAKSLSPSSSPIWTHLLVGRLVPGTVRRQEGDLCAGIHLLAVTSYCCTFSIHQAIVLLPISFLIPSLSVFLWGGEALSLSLYIPPWWKPDRTQQQHSCLFYNPLSTNGSVSSCLPLILTLPPSCMHTHTHALKCRRDYTSLHYLSVYSSSIFFLAEWLIINCQSGFSVSSRHRKNVQKQDGVSHLGGEVSFIMEENSGPSLPAHPLRQMLNAAQRLQLHFLWRQLRSN